MRDYASQFYSRPLRHCRPTASATFASARSVAAILALGCAALVAAMAGGVVWGLVNISDQGVVR